MSIFLKRFVAMEGEGTGTGASGTGAAAAVDWRTGLPADLAAEPSLKDFKDVAGLARSLVETKRLVGGSIRVPAAAATPEERAAYRAKLRETAPELVELPSDPEKLKEVEGTLWEKLGRPKEAKDYGFDAAKLEGVQFSDDEVAALRQVAQRRGYTKAQFETLVKDEATTRGEQVKAQKAARAELEKEYGAALDDKLREISVVAEKTGAPQVVRDAIKAGRIDKATAAFLLGIGKSLGVETRELAGQRTATTAAMTPAEAEAKESELLKTAFKPDTTVQDRARILLQIAELQRFKDPDLLNYQPRAED